MKKEFILQWTGKALMAVAGCLLAFSVTSDLNLKLSLVLLLEAGGTFFAVKWKYIHRVMKIILVTVCILICAIEFVGYLNNWHAINPMAAPTFLPIICIVINILLTLGVLVPANISKYFANLHPGIKALIIFIATGATIVAFVSNINSSPLVAYCSLILGITVICIAFVSILFQAE